VPHEALAEGLDVLREMTGRPPAQILKLATSRAADLLALPDRGRIAPGLRADLLIVEGNPLADLKALGAIRHVVTAGALVV
jgi:imidazolonepropionase-like amidohydrolase